MSFGGLVGGAYNKTAFNKRSFLAVTLFFHFFDCIYPKSGPFVPLFIVKMCAGKISLL